MASTGSSNPFIAGNLASLLHENMPIAVEVKEAAKTRPHWRADSTSMQSPDCIDATALSHRARACDR
jgi:hypothetical protein